MVTFPLSLCGGDAFCTAFGNSLQSVSMDPGPWVHCLTHTLERLYRDPHVVRVSKTSDPETFGNAYWGASSR